MISKVMEVKQHRVRRQASRVQEAEEVLKALFEKLVQAEQEEADYIEWKLEQERLLFAELSKQPAAIHSIEEFNEVVSEYNLRARTLSDNVKALREQLAKTEEVLAEARLELNHLRHKEQKFEKVVEKVNAEQRRVEEKVAQNLEEEVAAEIYLTRGGR